MLCANGRFRVSCLGRKRPGLRFPLCRTPSEPSRRPGGSQTGGLSLLPGSHTRRRRRPWPHPLLLFVFAFSSCRTDSLLAAFSFHSGRRLVLEVPAQRPLSPGPVSRPPGEVRSRPSGRVCPRLCLGIGYHLGSRRVPYVHRMTPGRESVCPIALIIVGQKILLKV